MAGSDQQPADGNNYDNFRTYLGRNSDEDMDVAGRTRKALDTGIDPEKTSLDQVIVHNALCMVEVHPGHADIYGALFPRLLDALRKADREGGSRMDRVFVFLKEAGMQIEMEHVSPPEGSAGAGEGESGSASVESSYLSDTDDAGQTTTFLVHGHRLLPSQLNADLCIQYLIQMLVAQHFHGKKAEEA